MGGGALRGRSRWVKMPWVDRRGWKTAATRMMALALLASFAAGVRRRDVQDEYCPSSEARSVI